MAILQQPGSINLSGNLKDVIVSTAVEIDFQLSKDGQLIAEETYSPNDNDRVTIKLKDLVDSLLSVDIPTLNKFEQTNAVANFEAVVDGTTINFKVVKGGVDATIDATNFLAGNWLTWQEQQKIVKYTDPEWLTYYATEAITVKVKGYFADESDETIVLESLDSGKEYSLNVNYDYITNKLSQQPTYYDVWAETSGGTRLSFVQRYVLFSQYFEHEDLFLFANTVGGIDTIRFTGEKVEKNELEFDSAEFDETTLDYDFDFDVVWSKNSGTFRTDRERMWSLEFFKALQKYFVAGSEFKRITITQPKLESIAGELNSYTFDYALSDQSKYLNLARVDELPETLEIIDPVQGLFFLAPRLSEFEIANISDHLVFPVQFPFVQEWKQLPYSAIRDDILGDIADMGFITGGEVEGNINLSGYAQKDGDNVFSGINVFTQDVNIKGYNAAILDSDLTDGGMVIWDAVKGRLSTDMSSFQPNFVTLDTDQIITGQKTFTSRLLIEGFESHEGFSSGIAGMRFAKDTETSEWTGELDALYVRHYLQADEFIMNQVRATNGNLVISSVAKVESIAGSVITCQLPEGETIAPFQADDICLVQRVNLSSGAEIKRIVFKILSVANADITISILTANGTIARGDTMVKIAHESAGANLIKLNVFGSNTPYISAMEELYSYADYIDPDKEIVRIGKLDGITDPVLGNLTGVGLYSQNVFLKGKFVLANNQDVGDVLDSKASQTEVNTLTGIITTNQTNITQNASEIALKASQSSLDTLTGRVTDAEASITINANAIALKVSQTEFDVLEGIVTTNQTNITQNASEIELKASQSEVDNIDGRLSSAESSIVVNANAITLKASQSEVDSIDGRLSSAESSIVVNANAIALKASQSEVNSIDGRLTTAESSIVVNAQGITSKVSKDSVISEINQSAEGIKIAAEKITFDGTAIFSSLQTKLSAVNFIDWRDDWQLGTGGTDQWSHYGNVAENEREMGIGPFGEEVMLWACKPDGSGGVDGGFASPTVTIDPDYTYRFTVFYKSVFPANSASTYFIGYKLKTLAGSDVTTPIFRSTYFPVGDWYMFVAIIHPKSYSGSETGIAGLYNMQGEKVDDATEYKWQTSEVETYFRAYINNADYTTDRNYFYNPQLHKIDGTEPSINALLNAAETVSGAQSKADAAENNAKGYAETYADTVGVNANAYSDNVVAALSGGLGDLAYEDLVGLAKLDDTVIEGGYIKTSLIETTSIVALGAVVAGTFNLGNGNFVVNASGELTAVKATIKSSTGTKRIEIDSNNEFKFIEEGSTIVRIGSSVFGPSNGIYVNGMVAIAGSILGSKGFHILNGSATKSALVWGGVFGDTHIFNQITRSSLTPKNSIFVNSSNGNLEFKDQNGIYHTIVNI